MLRLTDVIQPKSNERLEGVFRRHRGTLIVPLVLATLLIALPFFFLFSLTRAGMMGIVVLCLLLAGGVVIAVRSLYVWDATVLFVTGQRLIRVTQNGVWNRIVQEISLSSIYELSCESKGLWQTVFHVGTLRTRAAGAVAELVIPGLASPERARALIERLRPSLTTEAISSPATETPTDLRAHVHTLVDRAQLSTLETVKALLEKRVL